VSSPDRAPDRWLRVAALALVGLGGAGCVHPIDEETTSSGVLLRDCVVPVPGDIAALGAPVSLEYPEGSLWIWTVLALSNGSLALNASALVTSAAEVCSQGPDLRRDDDGSLVSLLDLSPAEVADNATRADGKHLWLEPTGGFVYQGAGYLFYEHQLGTGFLDSRSLGTGLCVLAAGASSCDRVAVGGSTLLWTDDLRALDQGGLLAGDRALVYGCREVASLSRICIVAGAPLAQVRDPSTYLYLNVFAGWVSDPLSASVMASELGPITVTDWPGGIIATTLDPFDRGVYIRKAASPSVAFDRRLFAFSAAPTEAAFPAGGREHPALRQSSLEINVSYAVERDAVTSLHLATFRFHGSDTGKPYQPGLGGGTP